MNDRNSNNTATLVENTSSTKSSDRNRFAVIAIAFLTVFWFARWQYWSTHSEELFSDMSDFEYTARGILGSFTFDFNPFFKSYLSPSIPLLRALQITLFGDTIEGWRIFQSGLLSIGILWVAYELYRSTRTWIFSVGVLVVFALSKPSIFWSFKLAREGIGESLMMLSLASCMYALRTRGRASSFAAGVIFCIAMLIRGTFIFALPFVLILFILPERVKRENTGRSSSPGDRSIVRWKKSIACTLLFAFGLTIVWTPWIIRTYRLYGAPVYLSTMGPYVFFWDLGTSKVTLEDGSVVEVSAQGLQDQASAKFPNDYEASVYAQHLMVLYIKQNLDRMPEIFLNRLKNTVMDPDVHLTRISRQDLYPETAIDETLLIDKKPWAILAGIAGLCLLPLIFPRRELLLLPLLSVIPWINAGIMIGYARMLESFISLFLFGAFALVILVARGGLSVFTRPLRRTA